MRIALLGIVRQADPAYKRVDALGRGLGLPAGDHHGLGHRAADRRARIERAVGVLEDHLHLAAHGGECRAVERSDVDAVDHDRAARHRHQPHDRLAERGLAAARFADQPQRLADGEIEADAAHRAHHARRRVEADMDVAEREQRHLSVFPVAKQATRRPGARLGELGPLAEAARHHALAARREGAALRQGVERRHHAGNVGQPLGALGAGDRRRADQADRIGVQRGSRTARRRSLPRPCGRHTSPRRGRRSRRRRRDRG